MGKLKKDNQGIALITVVIGVMFCLLLSSTMLRVSLLGMQSRSVNNQVSNTFYDAESVVDTVRMNLQNTAAKAWAESNNDSNSTEFIKKAYKLLTGNNLDTSKKTHSTSGNATLIQNLQKNAVAGGTIKSVGDMELIYDGAKLDGITIHDVEVEYKDPKTEMVSYVKTDISIRAPYYASSKNVPVASYSMFAGNGATLTNATAQGGNSLGTSNPNMMGYMEQEGNVYIGYKTYNNEKDANAVEIVMRESFVLSGDNVVINGNIIVKDHSNIQLSGNDVEIRGKILLGPNCHLVIGKDTNLKCQDIWFFDNDSKVSSKASTSDYKSLNKKQISMTGSKVYDKGAPEKYYDANSNNIMNNPYFANATSIVYIDGSKAYDAAIVNGVVKTQGGGILSKEGGITTNPNDENLYPIKNVEHNGHQYDNVFASIIDLDYFEKFCGMPGTKNAHCSKKLTTYKADSANPNKFLPANNSFDSSDVSGGTLAFNYAPGKSTNFKLLFASGAISNPINVEDHMFYLTNQKLTINMDASNSHYCGIFLTSSHVEFKKDTGYCYGQSLLSMDTTADKQYLKTFIDKVGIQITDTALDQIKLEGQSNGSLDNVKYAIFNNLFRGGIKCFYDTSGLTQSSVQTADDEHNLKMDLIEMSNYEKK